MVNLQNKEISNERQGRNEHGANLKSKAVTYLRSILDDDDQLIINMNKPQSLVLCPKVPPILRNNETSKDYYDPKIISFGPYHHGRTEPIQAAQTIKTKVVRNFILDHGKKIEDLYIKVHELNDHTRSCYVDGSTSAYNDEEFALMMLQDGCFILFIIELMIDIFPKFKERLTLKIIENMIMISNYLGIMEFKYLFLDLLLLENQIPYKVLNVLMSNIYEANEGLTMIKSFLYGINWGNFQKEDTEDWFKEEPHHLLGLLYTLLISKRGHHVETVLEREAMLMGMSTMLKDLTRYLQSFGSVSDLQAKGINFKASNSTSLLSALLKEKPKSISLQDVAFRSGFFFPGELKLPPLILDSDSQAYYTNLIAFEMCGSTDFRVASYISFMNSLIANPEDVKALRSKRIILHTLSSDEEVLKMLKEISAINVLQNLFIYQGVRRDIEEHCNSNKQIWMAELRHKYFSQPWSLIGFLAAVVVLILSFLQTFYTINPRKG